MKDLLFSKTDHIQSQLSFLVHRIWKENMPLLIKFFIWLLARDRISSNELLVRRGILQPSQSACSFCFEMETNIHLVIQCNYAWMFWSFILLKCNVRWVFPLSLEDFYIHWVALSVARHRNLWKLIWFFGTWNLWKARNKRVFQDESVDIYSLVFSSICNAVQYYRVQNRAFFYTGNDVFRSIDFFYLGESSSCTSNIDGEHDNEEDGSEKQRLLGILVDS
ncbi:uncharacterized protein LOC126687967 [Mercurialis annua]|uniref:uncharacterized protein LOC126687967 n=1 Tax=Mercurialis annua TaxID=3986 RepID=UPI00215DEAA8|nr:uncharacterized protein LOC126687967 [Mercurialis annua]